jgi:signal transduction histidine kinase
VRRKQTPPKLFSPPPPGREGLILHFTIEGVESYDAFAHSELSGWTVAVAAPVALIEAPVRHALLIAALGAGLALLASAIVLALFGSRLIQAIASARRSALALGQGARPAPDGAVVIGDELRALHEALADAGDLLAKERASREEAEAQRGELLQRERAAREVAQAQNEAKDRFLAMLGHELRNPLAAISGATAVLDKVGGLEPRNARALEIIQRQNRHLSRIVNDLLDVSRLMAGKIVLETAPLELSACVRSALDALAASAPAEHHRIERELAPVWIQGDAVRIEQIVNNLVGNALKYSPDGGVIQVNVAAQDGQAVLSVTDDGCGMDAELLASVFEPFVQGPAPANRASSGLGIGLALVKQLVELHGGHISARSPGRDKGAGSTFSIRFPAIEAQAAQEQPAASDVK